MSDKEYRLALDKYNESIEEQETYACIYCERIWMSHGPSNCICEKSKANEIYFNTTVNLDDTMKKVYVIYEPQGSIYNSDCDEDVVIKICDTPQKAWSCLKRLAKADLKRYLDNFPERRKEGIISCMKVCVSLYTVQEMDLE